MPRSRESRAGRGVGFRPVNHLSPREPSFFKQKNRRPFSLDRLSSPCGQHVVIECRRRDSNSHASRRHPLKMVCLPIPPLRPRLLFHRHLLRYLLLYRRYGRPHAVLPVAVHIRQHQARDHEHTTTAVVTFVMNALVPELPKSVWLAPLPNAAPMSEPRPVCKSTTRISAIEIST